jgi:hypothetical protein
VAVILAVVDEEDLEGLILAHSPKFQAIMKGGKEEIRRGEGIEHDEFWAEVEVDTEGQG